MNNSAAREYAAANFLRQGVYRSSLNSRDAGVVSSANYDKISLKTSDVVSDCLHFLTFKNRSFQPDPGSSRLLYSILLQVSVEGVSFFEQFLTCTR